MTTEAERMTTTLAGHDLVSWIGHQMHNEGTVPLFVALEVRAAVVLIEAEAAAAERERIKDGVEGLRVTRYGVHGPAVAVMLDRAAVLRIVEGKEE